MAAISRPSIETTSEPGQGQSALPAAELAPAAAFDGELVNILIVDDEPRNLSVLETVLVDPRYSLVRAESADEALLALVAKEFALIVLDIHMPGMNGFELAQLIKQRKKTAEVPIIFLTAYYSEDQHVLEGYSTGAVDYLHKPINPTILRSKAAVFVELHIKRRECAMANKVLLSEVAERRRAQEQLLLLNTELEHRVDARTSELREAGAALCESEERLRLANQASGTGLWEWNLETNRLTWSPECYDIHGMVEGTFDGSLESFFELVHADDRARVRATILAAVEDRDSYACDFRIVRPGGRVRWVTTKGRAFFSRDNHSLRMIGTIIDISYRKETELKLLEADRQKDEFLATLAHELRNPLAPIRNAVQIMLRSETKIPDLQWCSDVIDRQVRQMTRLVDDLLEVSRITTGKLELRKETLDLSAVVRGAVETSLPLIEQDGHELTVTLPPQPVIVNADMIRMAQVFSNLLNNAAKYTMPGGRIGLRVEVIGSHALVSVKDAGTGIPAEMLPHIFEMFTQVDRNLGRSQGGLGIGLALVRRLVEMHGGTIEAHSNGPGTGSEFVVRLPLASDEPGPQEIEVQPDVIQQNGDASPKRRILVVDDNKDSAQTLGMLLSVMGNEVRLAHDGPEALEAATAFLPHVVLLDIGLPGMSGYDVARRMRQMPAVKDAVLIAQTGWGQDRDKRQSEEAGFNAHLIKPIDATELRDVLAGCLRPANLE